MVCSLNIIRRDFLESMWQGSVAYLFLKTPTTIYAQESQDQQVIYKEAVDYLHTIQSPEGEIRHEEKENSISSEVLHIGPTTNDDTHGVGDRVFYEIKVEKDISLGILEVRYSDDVADNTIDVYLNNDKRGVFRTIKTKGWDDFKWSTEKINLGPMHKGFHVLELSISKGGNFGLILDVLSITDLGIREEEILFTEMAYKYVISLIDHRTGLVASAGYERDTTTVFKCSLACLVILRKGNTEDIHLAEGILIFFKNAYDKSVNFDGFNKHWNTATGEEKAPLGNNWVGDNAFLLIALNFYKLKFNGFGKYEELALGLARWLISKVNDDIEEKIIPEGIINIYAALKPFKKEDIPKIDIILNKLSNRWNNTKEYEKALDHIDRGALVMGDISGFNYIDLFKRHGIWEYNNKPVKALADFVWKDHVNIEISAQILVAYRLFEDDIIEMGNDLSYLEDELNKLWLFGPDTPDIVSLGLPYHIQLEGETWIHSSSQPIIDPVAFMLFAYWKFNPMIFE